MISILSLNVGHDRSKNRSLNQIKEIRVNTQNTFCPMYNCHKITVIRLFALLNFKSTLNESIFWSRRGHQFKSQENFINTLQAIILAQSSFNLLTACLDDHKWVKLKGQILGHIKEILNKFQVIYHFEF